MNPARDVPNPIFKAEPNSKPWNPPWLLFWSLRLVAQAGGTVTHRDIITPRPPLRAGAGNFSARFPEKNLTQTQWFGINLLSSPNLGANQIPHSGALSGLEAPQKVDEREWNFLANEGHAGQPEPCQCSLQWRFIAT